MSGVPNIDVVGVGLNATDTLIPLREFPARGSKVEFESAAILPGGQVASASGVRDMDVEGGRIKELGTVEGENAIVAQRGGAEFVGEFFLHDLERAREIGFGGDAAGNVFAGDEVIDVGKERVDSGIKVVQVGDDGDFCGPGPTGSDGRGGSIKAIEEKRTRGGNPFALEFGGLERQAFIVAAEDGTFAVGVNQNEGLVAGATRRGEEMRFDASVCEGDAVKLCGVVVAKFADVARA